MTFEEALASMRRGKNVRRPGTVWIRINASISKPDIVTFMRDQQSIRLTNEDLLADDWEFSNVV